MGVAHDVDRVNRQAADMLERCRRDGQAVGRVTSKRDAAALRKALATLSRPGDMRIRTALMPGGAVAVARMDAQLWNDDTATMRAKLTLPD